LVRGGATITATGLSNIVPTGSGGASITATGSYNNFAFGIGTFDIHTSGFSSFSASDPSQLHAGDVIDVAAGSNGSLSLSGPAGAEYNLSGVSLTNVQNLSLGSGVIFYADASSLAIFHI